MEYVSKQEKSFLPDLAPVRHFVPLEEGLAWVAPAYREALIQQGLGSFEEIMACTAGQKYKQNRFRAVLRLELPGQGAVFLKRHFAPQRKEAMKAWLTLQQPASAALAELTAIAHLQEAGIPTLVPIAFGQRPGGLWEGPSFLITEEIRGAVRVEDYLVERFSDPCAPMELRWQLTRELATLARTMHQAQIHHRDFYLGHILIAEENGALRFWVIDVQRVRKLAHLRERWLIKDLAQMAYTCPAGIVTTTDKLRFYLAYRQRLHLLPQDRAFFQAVVRRNQKTLRHSQRKRARAKKL